MAPGMTVSLPPLVVPPALLWQAAMGMVESGKGISIRFPRLVKVRDDKGPEDATTAEQVMDMYRNQAVAKANAPAAKDDDDDF